MAISSVNPATGEEIEVFEEMTDEEVDRRISLADETFREYRKTSFEERRRMMLRLAGILEEEAADLGRIMTTEMGKTLAAATAEAKKCARACRYYAENAERFLADEEAKIEGARAFVRYEPMGPILAIMPWNFPFWQAFRHAAPALMAGNVILLKHASNVPRCALKIEEVIRRAG
ncbi:MAG: aldehyde dehydrogenase family protein, partial [Actinomycetota bacterium]